MNLGAVLLTGLFAGGISCAAVEGGLLAGLVTRQRSPAPATPGRAKSTVGAAAGPGRRPASAGARPNSYQPRNIAVKAGVPTILVLRSVANDGCTRGFVIPSPDQQWILPENGDTRIDLGVLQPGTLRYTCSMGMYSGQLSITE